MAAVAQSWTSPLFLAFLSPCCICSSSGVCFRLDFELEKGFYLFIYFYKG